MSYFYEQNFKVGLIGLFEGCFIIFHRQKSTKSDFLYNLVTTLFIVSPAESESSKFSNPFVIEFRLDGDILALK